MIERIVGALLGVLIAATAIAQNASYLATALSNTAVTVKAAKGSVVSVHCSNPDAGIRWVQLYDTVAAVVVGTTVPKASVPFPASTSSTNVINVTFLAAIKAAATTTQTGGVAPTAPLVCDVIFR